MDRQTAEFIAALEDLNDRPITDQLAKRLVGMVGNGVEIRTDRDRGFRIFKLTLSAKLPIERGKAA